MATTFDRRNNWEKKLGLEAYSIRRLVDVFEIVIPKFKQEGEFPAQTLRRLFLAGEFVPGDLRKLNLLGQRGIALLLLQLGIAEVSDSRFIESV